MNSWRKIQIVYWLARYARKPQNYGYLEKMRAILREQGWFAESVRHVLSSPGNLAPFAEHWLLSQHELDLGRLRELPRGTVGRSYVEFLDHNGLNAEFFQPVASDDREGYFIQRTLQTHDLWHVLLGLETSPADEIRLQAIMYFQLRWPGAGFLIGGYIFRTLFSEPHRLADSLQAIADGWRLGAELPSLFGIHWERWWERPLEELRIELGIGNAPAVGALRPLRLSSARES